MSERAARRADEETRSSEESMQSKQAHYTAEAERALNVAPILTGVGLSCWILCACTLYVSSAFVSDPQAERLVKIIAVVSLGIGFGIYFVARAWIRGVLLHLPDPNPNGQPEFAARLLPLDWEPVSFHHRPRSAPEDHLMYSIRLWDLGLWFGLAACVILEVSRSTLPFFVTAFAWAIIAVGAVWTHRNGPRLAFSPDDGILRIGRRQLRGETQWDAISLHDRNVRLDLDRLELCFEPTRGLGSVRLQWVSRPGTLMRGLDRYVRERAAGGESRGV